MLSRYKIEPHTRKFQTELEIPGDALTQEPTNKKITHDVTFPISPLITVRELGFQIMRINKLPPNIEQVVMKKLKEWIDEQNEEILDFYQDISRTRTEDSSTSPNGYDFVNATNLMSKWSQKLKEAANENKKRSSPEKVKDMRDQSEEVHFALMYHELLHSGVCTETVINLQNSYALSVNDLIEFRNRAIKELHEKQSSEMEDAVAGLGRSTSEADINSLSSKHLTDSEKLLSDCETRIAHLKATQVLEFKDWIIKVYEDYKKGRFKQTSSSVNDEGEAACVSLWSDNEQPRRIKLEESFTINLGSQLKCNHNLRLMGMDVLDLCRCITPSGQLIAVPQRIQTAMSLFSNSLSALVLLVDNRIKTYNGMSKEFASICAQVPEFHFDPLEAQLEAIRAQTRSVKKDGLLGPGDFYLTKHSNLCQVHAVFHLVSDDSLQSPQMNSRHPVILGLRNVLKAAHNHDIKTLYLPLFLMHEMTEQMTIDWCMKRAELVLKCVKGFLIETATSSISDDNRTLQFLVPHDISEELFNNLAQLLPTVFRVSNPLILKQK